VKSIAIRKIADGFKPFTSVQASYLNTDTRKNKSSQKQESRLWSAVYSKAHSKLRAFNDYQN